MNSTVKASLNLGARIASAPKGQPRRCMPTNKGRRFRMRGCATVTSLAEAGTERRDSLSRQPCMSLTAHASLRACRIPPPVIQESAQASPLRDGMAVEIAVRLEKPPADLAGPNSASCALAAAGRRRRRASARRGNERCPAPRP